MSSKKRTTKDKIKKAPPPTLDEPEFDGLSRPEYDSELPEELLSSPQTDNEYEEEPPQELRDLEITSTSITNNDATNDNLLCEDTSDTDSLEFPFDNNQYVYAPRDLPSWDHSLVTRGIESDALLRFLTKYERISLFDRIAGMIYGCALGECLGLQTTGLTPSQIQNTFGEVQTLTNKPVFGVPAYSWYCNTNQMLLNIQSLTLNKGVFDVNDFARILVDWCRHGMKDMSDMSGVGVDSHTMKVTSLKTYLDDPIAASKTKTKSYSGRSNSAIVRSLPCGAFQHFTNATINCTAVTHANSVAIYASWALSTICRNLWHQNLPLISDIVRSRIQFIKTRKAEFNKYRSIYMCEDDEHDAKSDVVLDNQLLKLKLDDLSDPSYVLKTLGCGIYSLNAIKCVVNNSSYLSYDNIFKEIQINIVNQGGDAVTNACVSGAVLGSWLGYSKLPKDWIYLLKNKSWLDQQIINFLKVI